LEHADGTGNVSYDPDNHDHMVRLRAAKVAGIVRDIPDLEVDHEEGSEVLVLGWGSTYGTIGAAVRRVRARGRKVAQAHLIHLNPFPANLGDVLRSYRQVLVPEINLGQLARLLRAEFLIDIKSVNKIKGLPFRAAEIEHVLMEMIG
jgi:2-oxoglutarate ferredoxin oxidoreductase subunit alpha